MHLIYMFSNQNLHVGDQESLTHQLAFSQKLIRRSNREQCLTNLNSTAVCYLELIVHHENNMSADALSSKCQEFFLPLQLCHMTLDCQSSSAVAEHPMNSEVPGRRPYSLHARSCPQIYQSSSTTLQKKERRIKLCMPIQPVDCALNSKIYVAVKLSWNRSKLY